MLGEVYVMHHVILAGKLRTADCVAKGDVEVVVMSKKDFQDLDNPLLTWMIDYDAVATVLKVAHQPLLGAQTHKSPLTIIHSNLSPKQIA